MTHDRIGQIAATAQNVYTNRVYASPELAAECAIDYEPSFVQHFDRFDMNTQNEWLCFHVIHRNNATNIPHDILLPKILKKYVAGKCVHITDKEADTLTDTDISKVIVTSGGDIVPEFGETNDFIAMSFNLNIYS